MPARRTAVREGPSPAWEDVFFFGVLALAPAPLFATSMSYFGMLIVALVFLGWLAAGGWRKVRLQPLDLAIAAFLAVRVASTLTSVAPAASWKGLEKSGLLLLYYPLAHMALSRGRRIAAIIIFLCAAAIAALAGGAGFAFRIYDRVTSSTGGYTTFAEILAVALCLLAAATSFLRGRRRWGLSLSSVLPLAALVLTFCRGQWLAFVAGFSVVAIARDRRLLLVIVLFAAAAAAAVWLSPAGLASGRFTLGDPAFENYREVLWGGGLETTFARPLTGFGPETIKLVFPHQTRFYSPVAKVTGWHNDFMQLAIESGLGAVAAAIWLWFASASSGWRAYGDNALGRPERAFGLGLVAANVVLLVSGLIGNVATDPTIITVFAALWGLYGPLGHAAGDGR